MSAVEDPRGGLVPVEPPKSREHQRWPLSLAVFGSRPGLFYRPLLLRFTDFSLFLSSLSLPLPSDPSHGARSLVHRAKPDAIQAKAFCLARSCLDAFSLRDRSPKTPDQSVLLYKGADSLPRGSRTSDHFLFPLFQDRSIFFFNPFFWSVGNPHEPVVNLRDRLVGSFVTSSGTPRRGEKRESRWSTRIPDFRSVCGTKPATLRGTNTGNGTSRRFYLHSGIPITWNCR